jgi:CAAX prenyl protease-like protein
VPIVEELAFRDYLRRKLIALNFETVALNRFTWLSFLGSSLVFGAFHGEFLAGTAAGMVFVLAVCRRGVLSDAILAHATSNALFCAYALVAGRSLLPS